MSGALLLEGGPVARPILDEVAHGTGVLEAATGTVPGLAVVLLGGGGRDRRWLDLKAQAAAEAGMRFRGVELPASTSVDELLGWIEGLNADPSVHGILVQLPLPEGVPLDVVREAVHPAKDVDAFHPMNAGRLAAGATSIPFPCTAGAALELLSAHGALRPGVHAVVLAGDPLFAPLLVPLLSGVGGVRVSLVRTDDPDPGVLAREGEVLVVAAGVPRFVLAGMVGPGAVVIDTGLHPVEDPSRGGALRAVGDVDFEGVREVASALTPVPGGVGPVAVAVLLRSTLACARNLLEPTA